MAARRSCILWAAPILVGALIRLFDPTRQSLWVDEILSLQAASLGEPFSWSDVLTNPQGPLPHVWLRLWTVAFGGTDMALRLWSVFGGILGLGCAALALRKWAGRAGLWGLWIFSLSPYHLWYSLEVRNYVYMIAFGWIVLWAFKHLRERPGWVWSLTLAGSLTLVLLSNLSGLFLVPVLVLAASGSERSRMGRWVLVACLIAVLLVAPWIHTEISHHMDLSPVTGDVPGGPTIRGGNTFSLNMLPYTLVVFLGGPGAAPALRSLHSGFPLSGWLTLVPILLALALAAGWFLWMSGKHRPAWERLVLWLWASIPMGLAAVIGILGLKAFNPRYVAIVLPAWTTLMAYGVGEGMIRRHRVTSGALVLFAAVVLVSGLRQTFDTDYQKEDFRGVARYVQSVEQETDVILVEGVSGPFERYYRGHSPVKVFHERYVTDPAQGERVLRALTVKAERVIWVGSRLWYIDPDRILLEWLDSYGTTVDTHTETGVEVRVYERAPS